MKKLLDVNILYLLMLLLYNNDNQEVSKFNTLPSSAFKDTAIVSTDLFSASLDRRMQILVKATSGNKSDLKVGTGWDPFQKDDNSCVGLVCDMGFIGDPVSTKRDIVKTGVKINH